MIGGLDPTTIILAAALGMFAVMACAWVAVSVTGNGVWIDVFWSFGTGALGVAYALAPADTASATTSRQIVVAVLIGAWGLRLGSHLASRVAVGPEDARYAGLRNAWGRQFSAKLFGFAMVQPLVSILLGFSVRFAADNPAPDFRILDVIGVVVLLVAVGGAWIADRQLRRFKGDLGNFGKVCDSGLWSWSRHPNYFFEWLGWVAFVFIAIGPGSDALGWLTLMAPAFMYLMLRYVSGVPPLERHMVASRGEAYRAYQARTSAFFPIPPR